MPLPFWRDVVAAGELRPKTALSVARPTTERIDRALGFDRFVHLYLVQGEHRIPDLPILGAQLKPSVKPSFPHVALELQTDALRDDECVICNWNLAVSRPGVPGVAKGGNWTRGTRPERILEVWDALREIDPSPQKARGFFGEGRVPTLRGTQIRENLSLLRRAPCRGMPELMLEGPVPLSRFSRLIVFSEEDRGQIEAAGLKALPILRAEFPGYVGGAAPEDLRARIAGHFAGEGSIEGWDFDSIRPSIR